MSAGYSEINASARYQATRLEINQRLAIRTQINCFHTAAVVAVAGAFLSVVKPSADLDFLATIPLVMIPIISTIFVFQYLHNENTIGLLTLYASLLERNEETPLESRHPDWFCLNPKEEKNGRTYLSIQEASLYSRRLSDFSLILLLLTGPSISIGYYFYKRDEMLRHIIFVCISTLFCLILICFVFAMNRHRKDLLSRHYASSLRLWDIKPFGKVNLS